MKNYPTRKLKVPEIPIYLGIIFAFSLIILILQWPVGILTSLIFFYLIYYNWRAGRIRRKEWAEYLEDLSENIDWATKNVVMSIPMPLVVVEMDGSINWYNSYFNRVLNEKNLMNRNINDYIPELNPRILLNSKKDAYVKEIDFRQRRYRVTWTPIQLDTSRTRAKIILLIYWQDITEETALKARYQDERTAIIVIQIDNYDEVLTGTDETKRPVVLAEIEAKLGKWAASLDASWRKYDRDKFIVVIQSKFLRDLEERKFAILDEIREINAGNHIPVTLSMGVGAEGKNPAEASMYAQSALDLALGRGGDQAVVKKGTKLFFYGGKAKAVEKRSKVKSRVIASALRDLMEQSDKVIIMSHQSPDLDSFGAALGIYRCASHIGKEAHIIFNGVTAFNEHLIKRIFDKPEYNDVLISTEEARRRMDPQTLLVVVDTHRPSFVESPDILAAAERIVVIDHHRRSSESIEHSLLSYLEPYASSASELVTEIIQYFDEKVKLKQLEAEALLAGITMDTKNFILKTGVRTFEAAAYLKRTGAEPTSVRQLFQDDFETFTARAETIKNAKMVAPGIVISQCGPDVKNAPLIAAQAADGLITIKGIAAAFVLSRSDDAVFISGRSLGGINVQIILEKLGGGGHLTIAGARLAGVTIDEVQEKLIEDIREYLKEGENK